ncbi:MAG TPA: Ldh family oxidoreductase [Thermotogota bacterium]|nr:Ldh family oxidoreductase [Thermotogota bacterium]HRW92027.1 Ldh family oxidoreductase [Thermotogota bacterium]
MQETNGTWIPFEWMQDFMQAVFVAAGVPEEDAQVCTDVLLAADKRGIDSHGIGRLKPIYIDRIQQGILNPVTRIEILRDGPATAVVDGNNGMGHVIGVRCMEMAIEKARTYGLGMVVARNSTHYGIAGYYGLMASEQDMIGLTGTNARPSIAPTFGVENMLGTNPMTWVMPTDEGFPFFLDCATSITQRGKIEVYEREGKQIPEGWVIGKDGQIRTDTSQILKDLTSGNAALLPLGGAGEQTGGYKGYGYATVVEILSAALQGGSFLKMLSGFDAGGNRVPYPLGHFFLAINIDAFTDVDSFKQITGDILRELRHSLRAPGQPRIFTPGEKEHDAWMQRKDKGVPVNDPLKKDMEALRESLGLDGFHFPWEQSQ